MEIYHLNYICEYTYFWLKNTLLILMTIYCKSQHRYSSIHSHKLFLIILPQIVILLKKMFKWKLWIIKRSRVHLGISKSFRTGRLERELQMVHLSATKYSCITISRASLVSFAAITLCVASQRVYYYCCLFRYRLSTETFGYTLVQQWTVIFNYISSNFHHPIRKKKVVNHKEVCILRDRRFPFGMIHGFLRESIELHLNFT
jgi:hypothetical protein